MSQIPEVPASVPQDQRRFFTELRNSALRQEPNRIAPSGVSNVQVTPIGGGNLVTFTRSADAEGYLVYSQPSSPVSATSLAPGTATTLQNPPVSAEVLQSSNETNLPVALKPVSGSLLR
jgi:hypothetical protein